MHRLLVILLLAAGCVSFPQTPDEFRKAIPNTMFGKVETTDVNRPLRDVGKAFQARAQQCLAVTIEATDGARHIYRTLTPTVLVKADKVELYVQHAYRGGGVITPGKTPDAGPYYLVADVTPVDKGHAHLVMYGARTGDGPLLMKAIAGWASGEISGCPDLTK